MKPFGVDFKKAIFDPETGFLTIPTGTGYDINMRLSPSIKIEEIIGQNREPGFFAQLNISESNITATKNPIRSQEELTKFIKELPFIPEGLNYKDFLLGFIYSQPQDPDNHKWFMQFRNDQDQFIEVLTVPDKVDILCPVSTFSWFDGNWHGRLKVVPNELDTIETISDSHVKIKGKKCAGYKQGDISIMPEGTDNVVIRYNIFKNKWYCHFMKEDKTLKELECDSMIIDCPMEGFVNRSHSKPKVTQQIKPENIASIQFLSNTLIIQGI